MPAIVYDTETTGIDPIKDQVIQDAFLPVGFTHGELLREGMNTLGMYSATVPISYAAMAVHLLGEGDLPENEPFVNPVLVPDDYLIGHNIDFDWAMIGSPPCKRICTLAIARAVYPDLESHKLGAVYLFQQKGHPLAIGRLRNAHNASTDVEICFEVLQRICVEQSIHDMHALWQFSEQCRIPTKWAFGKHKGLPIKGTDRGYLTWCLRQDDMDPYVLDAVRAAL